MPLFSWRNGPRWRQYGSVGLGSVSVGSVSVGSVLVGSVLVGSVLLVALLGDWLVPYGVTERHGQLLPPSWHHPLGTDAHEYDVLTRVLVGTRLSLVAGSLSVCLALVIGTTLGAVAGYAGGRWDTLLMRGLDVLLAFPSLLIALLIVAAHRPGWPAVILAVAVINIPSFARQVRAAVLVLCRQEYITASLALGASHGHVLWRNIVPGLTGPLLILSTLGLGTAILEVASLAYLGVAGDPTTPEWGCMLNQARDHMHRSVWPAVAPGAAISLTILGFNLLGDGLRDLCDPYGMARSIPRATQLTEPRSATNKN